MKLCAFPTIILIYSLSNQLLAQRFNHTTKKLRMQAEFIKSLCIKFEMERHPNVKHQSSKYIMYKHIHNNYHCSLLTINTQYQ